MGYTKEDMVIKLINTNLFYAHLMHNVNLTFNDKFTHRAGVSFSGTKMNIVFNPTLCEGYTLDTYVDIFKHEIAHVILGHFSRRNVFLSSKPDIKIMNIAQDVALHEVMYEIKNNRQLADSICTVENLRLQLKDDTIKNNEPFEYYYTLIMNHPNTGQAELGESLDDHPDTEGKEEDINEIIKDAVTNARKKTKESGEHVPNYIEAAIDQWDKDAKVKWEKVLEKYVGGAINVKKRPTSNRASRRNPKDLNVLGKRKSTKPKVTIIQDTSGSMDGERTQKALTEVVAMQKKGYEILFIEADCVVHKHSKFDYKKKTTLTGRGGTAYQPGIDYALKLKPDVIIYVGDGDCADTPTLKKKVPFIWLLVGDTKEAPGNFGKTIFVE